MDYVNDVKIRLHNRPILTFLWRGQFNKKVHLWNLSELVACLEKKCRETELRMRTDNLFDKSEKKTSEGREIEWKIVVKCFFFSLQKSLMENFLLKISLPPAGKHNGKWLFTSFHRRLCRIWHKTLSRYRNHIFCHFLHLITHKPKF